MRYLKMVLLALMCTVFSSSYNPVMAGDTWGHLEMTLSRCRDDQARYSIKETIVQSANHCSIAQILSHLHMSQIVRERERRQCERVNRGELQEPFIDDNLTGEYYQGTRAWGMCYSFGDGEMSYEYRYFAECCHDPEITPTRVDFEYPREGELDDLCKIYASSESEGIFFQKFDVVGEGETCSLAKIDARDSIYLSAESAESGFKAAKWECYSTHQGTDRELNKRGIFLSPSYSRCNERADGTFEAEAGVDLLCCTKPETDPLVSEHPMNLPSGMPTPPPAE